MSCFFSQLNVTFTGTTSGSVEKQTNLTCILGSTSSSSSAHCESSPVLPFCKGSILLFNLSFFFSPPLEMRSFRAAEAEGPRGRQSATPGCETAVLAGGEGCKGGGGECSSGPPSLTFTQGSLHGFRLARAAAGESSSHSLSHADSDTVEDTHLRERQPDSLYQIQVV